MDTGWRVPRQGASRSSHNNRGLAWPSYSTVLRGYRVKFGSVTKPHTRIAILRRAVTKLRSRKSE